MWCMDELVWWLQCTRRTYSGCRVWGLAYRVLIGSYGSSLNWLHVKFSFRGQFLFFAFYSFAPLCAFNNFHCKYKITRCLSSLFEIVKYDKLESFQKDNFPNKWEHCQVDSNSFLEFSFQQTLLKKLLESQNSSGVLQKHEYHQSIFAELVVCFVGKEDYKTKLYKNISLQ